MYQFIKIIFIITCFTPFGIFVHAQKSPVEDTTTSSAFRDVSEVAGITASHQGVWDDLETMQGYLAIGQAWGDYDNDGWLDLYVTGNLDPSVLYHNNRDGTFSVSEFSETVSVSDVPSGGVTWADYDNDGWLDLYVLNFGANTLFRNEVGTGFVDVTVQAGVGDAGKGTSAAWGDYDNDGWLDLYITNWSCYPECKRVDFSTHQDRFYHNNGDGTFRDVTDSLTYEKTLGAGFIPGFFDFDTDGDLDLYVVNDKLKNEIGNVMWRNDGAGCGGWCWTDVSFASGLDLMINGMGLDTGDYDNDGDFDLYVTDMVYTMYLMRRLPNGLYSNIAREANVAINYRPDDWVGWGAVFLDYDNDGWQDIYVAMTQFFQSFPELDTTFLKERPDILFNNLGDGHFADVRDLIDAEPLTTLGVAYADYDRDGDLDVVTGNWNTGYRLYQNTAENSMVNHWLSIELIGDGMINRQAVGSTVYVKTQDNQTQMQSVKIGSGLGGNSQLALHFGLGTSDTADVLIVWTDETECRLTELAANQHLKIYKYITTACES